MNKLNMQMNFIQEIDQLKNIFRQAYIGDGSRHENDAEHTWHLSMLAIVLVEHTKMKELDLLKVLKMILIHDLVEIDAGDTFAFDEVGYKDKEEREHKAAERIFGLLPNEQKKEFMCLWREFELQETMESKYAASLDKLHPLIQNYMSEGVAWKKHRIRREQILKRNESIKFVSEELWVYVQELIDQAVLKGYLLP
ncbi:HD domain-containing protein [Bacillus timonensis]|nr:HD domain-containing protein [Bacillus timonensis]